MTLFNVFSLLGGLALFLFGMDIMGKALEKQAGGHLQKILSKLTDNPFKGFFLGLCVTAIIQSSSATTVMVVGFVNSGIMELHQAIGIIMGSNVGTTVTSWLLSLSGLQGDSIWIQILKPTSFSPILAFIGILLYMGKNEKKTGHRRHPKFQRQRWHPAGAERYRRHHLRQRYPHHHGSEYRHLCHRADFFCGRK